MIRVALVGAGGHARVVWDALRLISEREGWTPAAVVDDDQRLWGRDFMGLTIRGPLASLNRAQVDAAVVAIGDNHARQTAFAAVRTMGIPLINILHPRAVIANPVQMGSGIVAFANVVVNIGSHIGDNVILNTGCTVDHDCVIGPHVHLAPGVHLAGGVSVGEGTLVGIGSVAIPGVTLGRWAVVGAGSALVRDVPDQVTVAGTPARILNSKGKHGL